MATSEARGLRGGSYDVHGYAYYFSVWDPEKSQVTVSGFRSAKIASAQVCANRCSRENKVLVLSEVSKPGWTVWLNQCVQLKSAVKINIGTLVQSL